MVPVMAAVGGRQAHGYLDLSVDTRLVDLTFASGTLGDLPLMTRQPGELQKSEHSGLA